MQEVRLMVILKCDDPCPFGVVDCSSTEYNPRGYFDECVKGVE